MKTLFILSLLLNTELFHNSKKGIKFYKKGDYETAINLFLEEMKNKKKFKDFMGEKKKEIKLNPLQVNLVKQKYFFSFSQLKKHFFPK